MLMEINIDNSVHYFDYRKKLYVLSYCYYYVKETSSARQNLGERSEDPKISELPSQISKGIWGFSIPFMLKGYTAWVVWKNTNCSEKDFYRPYSMSYIQIYGSEHKLWC